MNMRMNTAEKGMSTSIHIPIPTTTRAGTSPILMRISPTRATIITVIRSTPMSTVP